ncbi:MAG: ABC transporter permease [Candidatus Omnitrophica bacterium]|nr:Macrolide export ATP-binding/permease protein MacB [bacterium]NUN97846.1 ABC transporter permease [Candidatus Omnitrophota bacterium]
MRLFEDVVSGFEGLSRNRMRSALSALGIVIAVGSVVLVVSLGDQAKDLIVVELERRWGADLVVVENAPPERFRHWTDDWKNLKLEDVEALRKFVEGAVAVGGYRESESRRVTAGGENFMGQLREVDPDYLEARGRIVRAGRNLNWDDFENALKVCTLGAEVARKLFKTEEDAVGQEVRISQQRFQVVGVVDPKSEDVGRSESAKDIYIPLTTGTNRFSGDDPLDEVVLKAKGSRASDAVKVQVMDILFQRHGKYDFLISTDLERVQGIQNVVTMVQAILGALAGISLIVGGIVVMNTMLVSVTERTPEIGLRKSLGARRRDIVYQFLAETVALCFLSGILGIALGLSIAFGITQAIPKFVPDILEWPWTVSLPAVFIAFACSTFVGLASGVYPAWRASLLDPTVALRYE